MSMGPNGVNTKYELSLNGFRWKDDADFQRKFPRISEDEYRQRADAFYGPKLAAFVARQADAIHTICGFTAEGCSLRTKVSVVYFLFNTNPSWGYRYEHADGSATVVDQTMLSNAMLSARDICLKQMVPGYNENNHRQRRTYSHIYALHRCGRGGVK